MNIVIHGSCVTRDAFDPDHCKTLDIDHIKYFSRSSIISLNSKPFGIELPEIEGNDPHEKWTIFSDVNKIFYSYLARIQPEEPPFIIIDFIDERFEVVQSDMHFLTFSNTFSKSNLAVKFSGKTLKRTDAHTITIWENSCHGFIHKLKQAIPAERIILHKAYWQQFFYLNDERKAFDNPVKIKAHNDILTHYYSFFEEHFHGIRIIDLNDAGYCACNNHKWGLSPFHYETGYYAEFLKQFNGIVLQEQPE